MQTIQPFVRHPRHSHISENVSGDSTIGICVDLGLSEWYGLAHFEHPSSAPLDELRGFFPELDASYASTPAPERHGESLPQLHDRVAKAIGSIIRRSDREGHKAVLISTHAAVVIALGRVLTGQMEKDFGAFTCGLSKYKRRSSDDGQPPIDLGLKTGPWGITSAARGRSQIGEVRPEGHSDTEPAGDADPHRYDSERPGLGLLIRDNPERYGGWICELDSDCSFLRGGEERGW